MEVGVAVVTAASATARTDGAPVTAARRLLQLIAADARQSKPKESRYRRYGQKSALYSSFYIPCISARRYM